MTPKEKAEEIVRGIYNWGIKKEGQTLSWFECKQLATMSVDLLLTSRPGYPYPYEIGVKMVGIYQQIHYPSNYWLEVNKEIEKL